MFHLYRQQTWSLGTHTKILAIVLWLLLQKGELGILKESLLSLCRYIIYKQFFLILPLGLWRQQDTCKRYFSCVWLLCCCPCCLVNLYIYRLVNTVKCCMRRILTTLIRNERKKEKILPCTFSLLLSHIVYGENHLSYLHKQTNKQKYV